MPIQIEVAPGASGRAVDIWGVIDAGAGGNVRHGSGTIATVELTRTVVGDEQVLVAVVVVVGGATAIPSAGWVVHSNCLGYINEGAVALVTVEGNPPKVMGAGVDTKDDG